MSLLQSIFRLRSEENMQEKMNSPQGTIKAEDPRCSALYAFNGASALQNRRPDLAFDLSANFQEQCATNLSPMLSMEKSETITGKSADGKEINVIPKGGSHKGRAEVLKNFNQRYELYSRLMA
ncbi:unnamed protein product [Symbiodinium necroappetens]|uniref:Uncharacterized protein n=1 Tax=Symbiodinium necroappetens TaxID=1628268 RepID=A0A812TMM8_9DINO|nr:unnamed protein product [Symbiodinium necroappetens]